MEQTRPEREELAAEFAKVARVVRRPALRKSFIVDPVGTLEREGVNLRVIPEHVVDTLAELSYDELGLVSRFNDTLVRSGLAVGKYPDTSVAEFF